MLAHLINEPEPFADGPRDDTLELVVDDEPMLAALAYEAAPDSADRCWIPARRRLNALAGVPVA